MKTGIALLIALAPTIAPMTARADKLFNQGKGAAWDCRKDPVVNINHGEGTYTFTGKCKTINVNGSDNKITYRTAKSGKVTARSPGGGNTVEQVK